MSPRTRNLYCFLPSKKSLVTATAQWSLAQSSPTPNTDKASISALRYQKKRQRLDVDKRNCLKLHLQIFIVLVLPDEDRGAESAAFIMDDFQLLRTKDNSENAGDKLCKPQSASSTKV